jgi:AraC-like DNA-binding protein
MFDMPLRITRGARTFCNRDWRWHQQPGRATGFNLWFVVGGQGTLRTAQTTYKLHLGDCFLLRMWDVNIGEHDPDNPLVIPWVCFDCLDDRGRPLPPGKCPRPPEHRRISEWTFFDQLIQRILDRHAEEDRHPGEAVTWLRATLLEIAALDRRSHLSGLDLEHSRMIDGLCSHIRQEPEHIRNMDMLAAMGKCSVDHLIRVFRRHKGVTPWEYLIRCRVEKAANLLRFSSHSVSQIADLLGYADIYSFCKQFKARLGQTPSEYRRK